MSRLDIGRQATKRLRQLLNGDEEARATRFRFERDRDAFAVSQGMLRRLLERYLGEPAERLRFEYGPHGKPAISWERSGQSLRFNLSHSQGLAVFAFASSADVGVDVEGVRPLTDMEEIARNFFSKREFSALRRLPTRERAMAFFSCWTAKEAYIKGIGEGLSMPLDRFAVPLGPSEGAVRLRILTGDAASTPWSLYRFEPCPGYMAAVAVELQWFRLRRYWLPAEFIL
jgi:4'-phosphopantetheinyl transferase